MNQAVTRIRASATVRDIPKAVRSSGQASRPRDASGTRNTCDAS